MSLGPKSQSNAATGRPDPIASASTLQIKGLGRQKLSQLARKAQKLGTTPEEYVRHLVEEDLAISRDARTKTFAQIIPPDRDADEAEIDRLVEKARSRHHRANSRGKRS